MQSITTKFLGPTDHRGARIKATSYAGSVTIAWDDGLDIDENHEAAARALAAKLDWYGKWYAGSLPDNTGNCYVCVVVDAPAFVIDRKAV